MDVYTNGLLLFNVGQGDDIGEGHISSIEARLTGDHVVPEPSSIILLSLGLFGIAASRLRRQS